MFVFYCIGIAFTSLAVIMAGAGVMASGRTSALANFVFDSVSAKVKTLILEVDCDLACFLHCRDRISHFNDSHDQSCQLRQQVWESNWYCSRQGQNILGYDLGRDFAYASYICTLGCRVLYWAQTEAGLCREGSALSSLLPNPLSEAMSRASNKDHEFAGAWGYLSGVLYRL